MATNLRLNPSATRALRMESKRTGLSQQEILRRAVDDYLGLAEKPRALYPDWVIPPTETAVYIEGDFELPDGMDVIDALDRSDRI